MLALLSIFVYACPYPIFFIPLTGVVDDWISYRCRQSLVGNSSPSSRICNPRGEGRPELGFGQRLIFFHSRGTLHIYSSVLPMFLVLFHFILAVTGTDVQETLLQVFHISYCQIELYVLVFSTRQNSLCIGLSCICRKLNNYN